ncbi:MAG: hypothetical protein ABGX23_01965 [Nautiliaceae bacterium]
MKRIYILPFILMFLTISLIGCSKKEEKNNKIIKTITDKEGNTIKIVSLKEFNLTFKNDNLIYPNQKRVILFCDNSNACKSQEDILKKLNVNYSKTYNTFLMKYFKIENIPTTIVLDKNKTIKYEGFAPYEILKAEGF